MTRATTKLAKGLLILALAMAPLGATAWGEHGSAGILTDVEVEGSKVWINHERYPLSTRTKILGPNGNRMSLEDLDDWIDEEVSFVLKNDEDGAPVLLLQVHVLIED